MIERGRNLIDCGRELSELEHAGYRGISLIWSVCFACCIYVQRANHRKFPKGFYACQPRTNNACETIGPFVLWDSLLLVCVHVNLPGPEMIDIYMHAILDQVMHDKSSKF